MQCRIARPIVLAVSFAAASALIAAEPPKPPARQAVRAAPPAPPKPRRAALKRDYDRWRRTRRASVIPAEASTPTGPRRINTYRLQHVAAEVVLNAIDTLIGPSVKAAADPSANSVIVSATPEQLEAVEKLLVQLDTRPAKGPDRDIRVFKLVNQPALAVVTSAVRVIQELIMSGQGKSTLKAVADPVSGSIIASGTPDELARLEEFLEQYGAAGGPTETAVLQIKHRPAQDVMLLLKPMISPPSRMTVDDDQQMILIAGTKGQIQSITEVVQRLDRPQPSLRLTFHFVKNAKADEQHRPLPEALVEPAKALAGYGFDRCALLATLVVRTEASSEFEAAGGIGREEGAMQLHISGQARLEEPGKSAHLKVEARVFGLGPRAGGRGGANGGAQSRALFSVESTMSVPLGDHIVIAAAPTEHDTAQAIAVIVRAEVE